MNLALQMKNFALKMMDLGEPPGDAYGWDRVRFSFCKIDDFPITHDDLC